MKKYPYILLFCCLLLFFSNGVAEAYKFSTGKRASLRIVYTLDPLKPGYGSILTDAMNSWKSASNDKITFSYNSRGYTAYFTGNDFGTTGWSGLCQNILSSDNKTITDSVISINYKYTDNYNNWTIQSVMAHEIGHALGLAHEDPSNVLMYFSDERTVNTPQSDEINGIWDKYGL